MTTPTHSDEISHRPHGTILGRGVTRTAYQVGRWAVKIPNRGWLLRGWLANRSEWRQRHRDEVARPVFTLAHLALVMPMAEFTLADTIPRDQRFDTEWDRWVSAAESRGYEGDEAKPSSWGFFRDLNGHPLGGYRLIDFDRAWDANDRGLLGHIYYGNQERLARKWSRLPAAESGRSASDG